MMWQISVYKACAASVLGEAVLVHMRFAASCSNYRPLHNSYKSTQQADRIRVLLRGRRLYDECKLASDLHSRSQQSNGVSILDLEPNRMSCSF